MLDSAAEERFESDLSHCIRNRHEVHDKGRKLKQDKSEYITYKRLTQTRITALG